MARIESYDKIRRQLSSWEGDLFERALVLWLMLLNGINERDLGKKLVALRGLRYQLSAWQDLLEKGGQHEA